jgi:hypothetical protein
MEDNLILESAVLIADLNNYLMVQTFSGDNMLKAADLINRCGKLFSRLHPASPETADPIDMKDYANSSISDAEVIPG